MDPSIPENEFPRAGRIQDKLTFLVRYARIAPSSHNTQPWTFDIEPGRITLHTDAARWLRIADRDRRELHVSIGCALENLLVAAEHYGFAHRTQYRPAKSAEDTLTVTVDLSPGGTPSSYRDGLLDAIPRRHTNHKVYDGTHPSDEDLERLRERVVEAGVRVFLTNDSDTKRTVDALIARANAIQFADPEWREELGYWLGMGVFGTSWITSKMSQLAVTHLNLSTSTTKHDSDLLQSAPFLGVIATVDNQPTAQVHAGQALERIWLQATALGLDLHPMNQILQVPDVKQEVVPLLPSQNQSPQIAFRLGYATEPEETSTPRRDMSELIL